MADSHTITIVEDVRFLRPPRPFNWMDFIPHVLWGLVTVLVLTLACRMIRRRIVNGPSPKARALKALQHARHQREKRGDFWYLLRSNRILRDFFQDTFDIEAPAQTSRQFLESLRHVSILEEEDRSWLDEYLEACDGIRFAGKTLSGDTLEIFDTRSAELVTRLYKKKKRAAGSVVIQDPEPSPFLPGTPVPELDESGDLSGFKHSKPEMDSMEAPAQA